MAALIRSDDGHFRIHVDEKKPEEDQKDQQEDQQESA